MLDLICAVAAVNVGLYALPTLCDHLLLYNGFCRIENQFDDLLYSTASPTANSCNMDTLNWAQKRSLTSYLPVRHRPQIPGHANVGFVAPNPEQITPI